MSLTPELEAFARDLVGSGAYGSVDEVVQAAVDLLRAQRPELGDRTTAGLAPSAVSPKESFLLELGDAIRPMGDPGEIVAATTRALGERLGATRVVYADIDEDQRVATTQGDWTDGTAPRLPSRLVVADFGATLIEALGTGETLVVPDVRDHPATTNSLPALDAIGAGALVSVPLIKDGRFAANLNVHSRGTRLWTAAEVELIEAVAERTWDALARARAVAALAAREHELQTLTDALPVLISYVDAGRRYRFINKVYEDWFPRRRDEIIGRPVREVVGEAAYAVVAPYMDRVLAGERLRLEQLMPYADAAHRHIEVEYVPRMAEDGQVEGFYALVQDVSPRKATEAALRDSEARLRELNETLERQVAERTAERDRIWSLSRDLMCVARTDGTLLAVNPAWERLLGWPADWLTGRNAAEIKHPDDAARTAVELARLAQGHPTLSFEDRYRHKDGGWRWIAWTIEPEDRLIYCIGRDVTGERTRQAELQAAEAARREADALYRAYFENTAEALFVVGVLADGGFTVEDLNPAHQASVGFRLAEVAGRRLDDILPPDLAEAVTQHYRRVLVTGEVHQYRDTFEVRGETTHWDTVLVPVRDGEGRVVRIIGSSRDLTAQVAAEEALRQSQKMEAVGQLTGGLAHDFNNILAGVSGSLDLMETRIAQGRMADVGRYLLAAQGAAKRAAALTHRLLAFSRRQTLQPKATDVNRLVADLEELIRRTVGPAVEVEAVAKAGLWLTIVDPNQLENALLNLCINARDAMPNGGRITIETANRWLDDRAGQERDLPPGQYVSLCVSDNGTGMTPEVVQRAFDPFFTTKPTGLGTGLGLSMVYGFARQSGGQVRIYSEVGQGTMVCLYLPRHHAQDAVDAPVPTAEPPEPAGAGETVLVIDDEPLVRMVVVDVLEELGYRAIEAEDGPQGLRVIRSDVRLDLLITDVGLPNGMNGRQVADAAREVRPDLKVLFVTGYAENAVLNHGHLDPGMQVVTKPFDMARLKERIRGMIADR
jgi:PAS domain S-box-containing protein